MEAELVKNKLASPKSVWFIIGHEVCQRFNFIGLQAILVLYLTSTLQYSQDNSIIIYHGFLLLSFLLSLCGAVLGDSYWGKFKTMLWMTVVYAIGSFILAGTSLVDKNFTLDTQRCLTIVGLVWIAIGNSGIKPCTYTFGGEQFELPEQQNQLSTFLIRHLMASNIGSLLAISVIPELRKSVHCFGRDTCFPLAFGVLFIFITMAIVVFVLGTKLYVKKKPENHAIFRTFGCIFHGLRKKCILSTSDKDHWLDYAEDKYTATEVSDTKAAMEVLYISLAYPVFWALFEQKFSRWIFQATLMNGKLDSIGWEIKPDQMYSVFLFISIILYFSLDSVVYPVLAKLGIHAPLRRLLLSYLLAVSAFLLTALLQHKIFGESTLIPDNKGQFIVYNAYNCNVSVNSSEQTDRCIQSLGSSKFMCFPSSDEDVVQYTFTFDNSCNLHADYAELNANVTIAKGQSISYFLTRTAHNTAVLRRINDYDDLKKPKTGNPHLRIFVDDDLKTDGSFSLTISGNKYFTPYNVSSFVSENFKDVAIGNYTLTRGNEVIASDLNIFPATIYTLLVTRIGNGETVKSKLFSSNRGNYLHILWQLPQYLFMACGSAIFFSTSIKFSFTEAPLRIKSFISACYYLTHSMGNLIVIVISAMKFQKQVHEYLFFAGLMFLDMLLLFYLSRNYKYKVFKQRINDREVEENIVENNK